MPVDHYGSNYGGNDVWALETQVIRNNNLLHIVRLSINSPRQAGRRPDDDDGDDDGDDM